MLNSHQWRGGEEKGALAPRAHKADARVTDEVLHLGWVFPGSSAGVVLCVWLGFV